MTPQEFKAWFDGFTEAFEGASPSKSQWKRIQERVAEIDGKPVTERVYVDRYWPASVPYNGYPYWNRPYFGSGVSGIGSITCGSVVTNNTAQAAHAYKAASIGEMIGSGEFNSMQAMADLGRTEASNLGVQ